MVAETLADRDLWAMMAVIEDGRSDDPGPAVPWATLDGLIALIGCDVLVFNELEPDKCRHVAQQLVGDGARQTIRDTTDSPNDLFWRYYRDFMCSYFDRTTDVHPIRAADLYTPRDLANAPVQVEDPNPLKDCLMMPFPAGPGRTRKVCMFRFSGRGFSDREALMLRLLRPHIHDVFLDAERRRRGIPRLTRRECEVLQLAAGGYSNRDIADRLFISIGTVRKHMEHVFERTGARTRTAAAAIALPQPAATDPTPGRHRGRWPLPAQQNSGPTTSAGRRHPLELPGESL